MPQSHNASNDIVTKVVLIHVLMESADCQKLQNGIKQKFNVDIPVQELKDMSNFYQLLQKIKTDSMNPKTL